MIKILIPAHNEESCIAGVVNEFKKIGEVVVCDNNSNDKTMNAARDAEATVIFEKRKGKGFAIRKLLNEKADIYCLIDADGAFYAADVKKMLTLVKEDKADMVIGKRIDLNVHNRNSIFFRFLFIKLVKSLFNLTFRKYIQKGRIHDFMSGCRCFNDKLKNDLKLTSKGFEIETEITIQALKRGFRIVEVPIKVRPRESGKQKSNILNVGLPVFWKILFS